MEVTTTKIPKWWIETTNKGIKCIEKTYSWLGIYGTFKYYPHDESLTMHIHKLDTTRVFTNQSKILIHADIEAYCKDLIRKTYQEIYK